MCVWGVEEEERGTETKIENITNTSSIANIYSHPSINPPSVVYHCGLRSVPLKVPVADYPCATIYSINAH